MADKVIPPSTTAEEQPPVSISPDNEKQPIPSPIDPHLERRMLRKIDLHLMVPLWILFMLGFMDCINLGNVRVLGILKELHLTGSKFNIALQVFFVPYILLEIPSNIVLRKLSPLDMDRCTCLPLGRRVHVSGLCALQWRFDRLSLLSGYV
jgi:hypothetical protein